MARGLGIRRQCRLFGVSPATYYRNEAGKERAAARRAARAEDEKAHVGKLLEAYGVHPMYGYRKMSALMVRDGQAWATEKVVRRLYGDLGLKGLSARFRTTRASRHPYGKRPYLLGGKRIMYANQVWATDITYIDAPSRRKLYYVAVIDLHSRRILSWRLSETMDVKFCMDAVREALEEYGTPAIFNTDQGSQFTSREFVGMLEGCGIEVSQDGRGRWADNVLVERTWRTLKYEWLFLREYLTVQDLEKSLGEFQAFFNGKRLHQALDYQTPDEVYKAGCFPDSEDGTATKDKVA